MPALRRIEIGSRLRECRDGLSLSLADVAAELKVSKQSISAWETGERRLDVVRLADLALLYGVSSDFLLFGTHMVPQELRELFVRAGRGGTPSHPPGS